MLVKIKFYLVVATCRNFFRKSGVKVFGVKKNEVENCVIMV